MWNKSKSFLLSRILVWIFISALLIILIFSSKILPMYIAYRKEEPHFFLPLLLFSICTSVFAFTALFSMDRLLKNLKREQVFVKNNVRLLRIISWCCYGVAVCFLVFSFISLLFILFSVIFAFIGLMLRVAKNMFEEAVELKAENDLTV